MTLDELGPRICILGPSGSGKSTLADAIARARGLPAVHLDRLHHLPHTDWRPRPEAEFVALHDRAIRAPAWVIDGNYTRYLPQRLERATGLILLDAATATSLLRYVRRAWFERERRGGLEGAKSRVRWEMIHHIAFATPAGRRRNRELFERIALPKLRLAGTRELDRFYRSSGLKRPS